MKPFWAWVRPSATRFSVPVAGGAAARGSKPERSIAWPIPRTFGESSGYERRSTLSAASARRVASRSVQSEFQCVYQSRSGTRRIFATGAASTRKIGTMCESSASGLRRSSALAAPR